MGEVNNVKKEIISWAKAIVIGLAIALVIKTFIFSPYQVEGASMEPTLHDEEKLFVNKIYGITDSFARGDIIIIKRSDETVRYVKRMIGLPGDIIQMENDQLYVNDELVTEGYLKDNLLAAKQTGINLTGDFGPITVPEGQYFVLGDNRLYSMDSRNGLGFIEKESIIGKAEFVMMPFSNMRFVEN